jgi:hypothetical protein
VKSARVSTTGAAVSPLVPVLTSSRAFRAGILVRARVMSKGVGVGDRLFRALDLQYSQ